MKSCRSVLGLGLGLLLVGVGCGGSAEPGAGDASGGSGAGPQGSGGTASTGGAIEGGVGGRIPTVGFGPEEPLELETIQASLRAFEGLSAEGLGERYSAVPDGALGYDPSQAQFLDLIQASPLALNEEELGVLGAQGFVISNRLSHPHFTQGYADIYASDLPVYVSVDSILSAVHRSYDALLRDVESTSLEPTLRQLLAELRGRLAGTELDPTIAHDLGLFLGVAHGLLDPSGATGIDAEMQAFIDAAMAASGIAEPEFFGEPRLMDFSQFAPRGHYEEQLASYFRAMMWLGRVDFRLIETLPDGSRVLRRRQVEAAAALASLLDETNRARWELLDRTVAAFVGEPDYLTLPGLQALLAELGATTAADLAPLSDAAIESAIEAGGYGQQRIASHLMVVGPTTQTLPLNTSFAFLGQRYTADSHTFSNVTYDRVQELRLMPNPLDVAFAALGNDQAGRLLAPELERYGYAEELAATRTLVDAHERAYWQSSLYTLWLGALRQLSPSVDPARAEGRPAVATTEAWGRRVLGAQLASWAELRHDTLLYAKQSYTDIPGCEYPDAFVDPYPEAFSALAEFGRLGAQLLAELEAVGTAVPDGVTAYLAELERVTAVLAEMAELQRTGAPHTADHLEFINDAVKEAPINVVCAMIPGYNGWYTRLFYEPREEDPSAAFAPVIADVHTQPADEAGTIVGKVLHVGTGYPRTMVVTVDTCVGPRAYVGLVSSYHEQTTSGFERLTDSDWEAELASTPPTEVPWLEDIVTP